MTLRGRLTLLGFGVLPALLYGICGSGGAPARVAVSAPAALAAPSVSAAPRLAPHGLLERLPGPAALAGGEPSTPGTHLRERVSGPGSERFEVEYTLDAALRPAVLRILERQHVALGHVVVLDPASGALLAYVSSDVERFPPTTPYPAASLIKVVTAAAALDRGAKAEGFTCRTAGNPYRLTPARLDPSAGGEPLTLARALATSNNQCFAQLAVHAIGRHALLDAIRSFGLLTAPAPGHAAGAALDPGNDAWELGRLGCGLAGCRITPLHAARLAGVLADGRLIEPYWVSRIHDEQGRELALPPRAEARQVVSRDVARELREMLVGTTEHGTARRAFRGNRGRNLLQGIRVAGKTGSLSGRNPDGRYEWFIGAVPAEDPRVAIAVLVVQGERWWATPSQIAAEVLKLMLCPDGVCSESALTRWLPG